MLMLYKTIGGFFKLQIPRRFKIDFHFLRCGSIGENLCFPYKRDGERPSTTNGMRPQRLC
jgi:hypothetical protein